MLMRLLAYTVLDYYSIGIDKDQNNRFKVRFNVFFPLFF